MKIMLPSHIITVSSLTHSTLKQSFVTGTDDQALSVESTQTSNSRLALNTLSLVTAFLLYPFTLSWSAHSLALVHTTIGMSLIMCALNNKIVKTSTQAFDNSGALNKKALELQRGSVELAKISRMML